ncbi:MAG TPA: diguanylate cyclase [Novosphingobium sp.]|nr:diguanylate cyclase [Novosphingobium sp.]
MRLATITNWAYGATVALTLVSGVTMLLASNAQEAERDAVAQRYRLDQAANRLGVEVFATTELAREYVLRGDASHLIAYQREVRMLAPVEDRIRHLRDAGAGHDELNAIREAIRWTDALRDEQQAALAAHREGNADRAREILFGAEYERELDRAEAMIERFEYRLDQRTEDTVNDAGELANAWKTASEIVLALTGLLFLCVLYFVFKQRVLHPVVRLSDVVGRLAAQDYAVEPPEMSHIDEIGDMAQAIRVFRENGLARQRLEQERDADMRLRDLIARMTQRMQGCDTVPDLTEVVRRFVPEIAPGLAGRLYLFDESRNAMAEACSWLSPTHSRAEFSPLLCWALRRGVPHRPAGERLDVPCDHLDAVADGPVDTLCLPLTAQRETLGLLYLEARGDQPAQTATIQPYLEMLAENVSLALANLKLRDRLRLLAMADPLTGLANRRQLDAALALELADSERRGDPLSCLMLDVDHFKRFNDSFGHDAGDAVLRAVGRVLAGATREGSAAYRYGGEEFLLLLPGMGPDQALSRAEEVRTQIEALQVTHEGRELGAITASVGLASVPADCRPDQLVQAADAALLRAKANGRNRIEVAHDRRQRIA